MRFKQQTFFRDCLRIRRGQENSEGASTVEFAIVAPFLLILIYGVLDLGVVLSNYFVITQVVREGVRFGIGIPSLDEATVSSTDADYGSWLSACTGLPGPPGLPCSHIMVHRRVNRLLSILPELDPADFQQIQITTDFQRVDPADPTSAELFSVELSGPITGHYASWPVTVRQMGPYLAAPSTGAGGGVAP